MIEFVPQVGDFVAIDEPLFLLYGGAGALDDRELQEAVALGSERTLEQDPTFAFRILVDIAIKALSPAINDPTTAVLAIDQIHRLLRVVGLRHVSREEILDESGTTRLVFRTPNGRTSCTSRASKFVIADGKRPDRARVRSMLENLMQTLPSHVIRTCSSNWISGSRDRGAIHLCRRPGAGPDRGSAGIGRDAGRASCRQGANRRCRAAARHRL
jgi:uncharacterized membrane protein